MVYKDKDGKSHLDYISVAKRLFHLKWNEIFITDIDIFMQHPQSLVLLLADNVVYPEFVSVTHLHFQTDKIILPKSDWRYYKSL